MSETVHHNPEVPPLSLEAKVIMQEAFKLDSELEQPELRPLIEIGAQLGAEVTHEYGTPNKPKWHTGTIEERVMTYHNGGEDGHTSVGELGVGVPRAGIMITNAVNAAAGQAVFTALDRATVFVATAGHDRDQNCGRALLPEGQQGEGYGDERLSAERVRQILIESVEPGPQVAQHAFDGVAATAFNPQTKEQNIQPNNDPKNVLIQEATAAADLLSLTHIRGPVGSFENIVESMCSNQHQRLLQQALETRGLATEGPSDMGMLLDIIHEDATLHTKFVELMKAQAGFFAGFQFSDKAIREACGKGIDEIFPGREDNVHLLQDYVDALENGVSPRQLWYHARERAGYQDEPVV